MASPATKSASLASLLLLMVSLAAQASSQQKTDQLVNFSLQPATRMIAASWRILNPGERVRAFRVEWQNVKGSGKKEPHRCTVPYLVSESQQHSTEQCDKTPRLLPGTEYNVSLWKLNRSSRPLPPPLRISGRTLPEVTGVTLDESPATSRPVGTHVVSPATTKSGGTPGVSPATTRPGGTPVVSPATTKPGGTPGVLPATTRPGGTPGVSLATTRPGGTPGVSPDTSVTVGAHGDSSATAVTDETPKDSPIPAAYQMANRSLHSDQLTNLTLRPTSHMIAASWRLLNPIEQMASFRVLWWKRDDNVYEPHSCTVRHRVGESQNYSTEQCDETPTLQPCTKYLVVVTGMNNRTQVITKISEKEGYTMPEVASLAGTNSADNILVKWTLDLSCKALHHYVVEWGNEAEGIDKGYVYSKSAKNSTLHYIISGPRPCRVYNLTVLPRNNDNITIGPSSSIMVNTPARVTNFTAMSVGGRSVSVFWPPPNTLCNVTGYNITFDGEALWGEGQKHTGSVGVEHRGGSKSTYHFNLTDMVPHSVYNVCVTAANQKGNGTTICVKDVHTDETEPSVPTQFSLESFAHNITATWHKPTEHNGVLRSYNVSWKCGANASKELVSTRAYTIKGLPACEECRVKVTASTAAGEGGGSEVTSRTLPEAPGSVTTLPTNTSGTHSIALSWQRPNTLCNITGYYITYVETGMWTEKPSHSSSLLQKEDLVNTTYSFNLTGLVPYARYNVCVAALNEEGNSSLNCWKDLQTEQAKPSTPSELKVVSTTHIVSATWQKPHKLNGVLGLYNVSWQCGANTSTEQVSTTACIIEELPACVECRVRVTASTGAGEGESSEATTRTLPEAPDSVTSLKSMMPSARSVTLWWQRPVTLCNITSYYITYDGGTMWGEKNPHNGSAVAQENMVQTPYFFNLIGLLPYAQYNVCVAAGNREGNSSEQCLEVLQTKQARPSTPSTFSVVFTAPTTIRASWQVPLEHNGVLGPYNISWQCGAYTSYKLINTTVYTIEGSPAGVECRVRVTASTDAGEGKPCEESVWIHLSDPQAPPARLVAPIVGGVVAVLVTAAIVGGVILWRRGQARKSTRTTEDDYFKDLLLRVKKKSEALRNESNLIMEFLGLENGVQQTTTAASSPRNMKKNRFQNILPYDSHRVQLKRPGPDLTDYINASIVPSLRDDVIFIACQGPRDDTVEDFWWMVWEHEAETIVMLANCVEDGKNRCSPYWPVTPYKQMDLGSFVIRISETVEGDYYTVRTITLENGEEKKRVSQFHFTMWPDHGVPETCEELLALVRDVRNHNSSGPREVVVHCSAGVGRTGTFIALWRLQTAAESRDPGVDARKEVLAIRHFRMNLVQSPQQYLFLHDCFQEYLQDRRRWTARPDIDQDDVDSPLLMGTAAVSQNVTRLLRNGRRKLQLVFKKRTTEPDEEGVTNIPLRVSPVCETDD